MPIGDFLNQPINTVTREKIFFNRLSFDLKLAAARRGYSLAIFVPEVDREGFDIVLDDGDEERRMQLKSLTESSGTTAWKLHKRLLRPNIDNAHTLGFELSPEGVGLGGGVILLKIDDSDDTCPVTYYFTDIFIITAFVERLIISERGRTRQEQATGVRRKLHRGTGAERLVAPFGVFLKVRSPSCLLAIAGFHSTEESYAWWGNYLIALENRFVVDDGGHVSAEVDRTIVAHAEYAASSLLSLVDEPTLSSFQR